MRPIDADKLLERMKKGMESGSNLNGTFDLYIEHAPTIKMSGCPISRQEPITCDGCKHVGTYDTDFPCSCCIRREKDYYEPEEWFNQQRRSVENNYNGRRM